MKQTSTKLFSLVYDLFLFLGAVCTFPYFFYQMLHKGKYRQSFLKRWGLEFPEINKGDQKLIWVHTISVGEARAIAPLVQKLKAEGNFFVLVSSITETGHAEAQRSIAVADAHIFLPYDFSWIIRPIMQKVAPVCVILCESDFWFNFMRLAREQGSHVVLVNGKISERSCSRFQRVPFFTQRLFDQIDLFCIQSHHYAERFRRLGIEESKLVITGNIKFDTVPDPLAPVELEAWKSKLGIQPQDFVFVVGSSHAPEEELVLNALEPLWKKFPHLKVILVPRHPERFDLVATLFARAPVEYQRYTQAPLKPSTRLILLDTMGLLRQCYQIAQLALVAGSYTSKVGGHNITEPCWYGVPVIFGPNMHSQPEMVEMMKMYQAGLQIEPEQLPVKLAELLMKDKRRDELAGGGKKLAESSSGATERTLNYLQHFLR